MRHEISAESVSATELYRVLTSTVIPRPIAWVSSRSASGVDNLAPHSLYTVASSDPAVVQFTSIGRKDSVANIEATGEFVVCLAPASLAEQINASGTAYPPEIDEFDAVGVGREPSLTVAPYRVAGSPVAIECRLRELIEVGNGILVLGTVTHVAIDRSTLAADGLPDAQRLDPIARLGRDEWGELGELRRLSRLPYRP